MLEVGIIHFDIKPENIIFCSKENSFKINDFGMAGDWNLENRKYKGGTDKYKSPELKALDFS